MKTSIKICLIISIFLFITIGIALLRFEKYVHKNDIFQIFENKIVLLELAKGFVPNNEKFEIDEYKFKVPYGFKKVNSETAISFFSNSNGLFKILNSKYEFIDQLGSNWVWKDIQNNKLIFVYKKRYTNINYLSIVIKQE